MARTLVVAIALGALVGAGAGLVLVKLTAPKVAAQPAPLPPLPLNKLPLELRELTPRDVGSFGPLPDVYERRQAVPSEDEIRLGRQFFFDKRFSRNHDVSCNSCHPLDRYGVDGLGVSLGHLGQAGRRNSPTVYNAAGHGLQFWDGRASDVETQARMPVVDPFEMAMSEQRVVETLRSIPEYVAALRAVFPNEPDPVTLENFGYVVGSFERGLVTPSRWDDFLGGDEQALNAQEKRGFFAFQHLGCPSCHSGRLVGGTHFETLGQARPWPNQTDLGRNQLFDVNARTPAFKVASLRNVEKTAPYFHDASSETLPDAVRRMAEHQLGFALEPETVADVVAWLCTLTGDLPVHYIFEPELPPSTETTPKPESDGY